MLNKLTINFFRYLVVTALLFDYGCSKPKEDQRTGNLPTSLPITASTVRLVNLGGYPELEINGKTLTSLVHATDQGQIPSAVPTVYFPSTGKMGSTYNVPQEFLDSKGNAAVHLFKFPKPEGITNGALSRSFNVTENYTHPNDYYVVYYRNGSPVSATIVSTDSLFVVPRSVYPASDPAHIKIRLLNLSSSPDDAGMIGPMSLAFADGTPVSAATSGIATGNASDYVELPYGTYQFKVLTSQGSQVPGVNDAAIAAQQINRYTAVTLGSGLTFAPVQTFQPGGVYTIVVSANPGFQYPMGNFSADTWENAFRVITDLSAPANITYAKLQVANVYGAPVNVLIDNNTIATNLPYDSAGAYQVLTTGQHYIEIRDNKGNLLQQQLFTLSGGDNYTVWLYPKTDGQPGVLFAQNNLSGNLNTSNGDGSDHSYEQLHDNYPTWIRFLNFCPDLPLVTFTQANGQPFPDYYSSLGACSQNLAPGQPAAQVFQYVTQSFGISNTIQVYQSKPLVVPGNWLSDVPPLHSTDFIFSSSKFYPNGLPAGEPGVYTVALTGRYGANITGGQKAKMIIVKHTR